MAPPIDAEEVERRFRYYPPDEHRRLLHQAVRDEFRGTAHRVADILPESREKSLALTALEDGLMWANAAIARNVPDEGG